MIEKVHTGYDGKCCQRPALVRGWVGPRPFGRALFCRHCGETQSDMSKIGEWIWATFFGPFWDGYVTIPGDGKREVEF
jgi:hypothetical protein